jgi:mono/diheme cytochrome c family protein
MTDESGRAPEERLPAPRPPSEPAPVDRFIAPRQAHEQGLNPGRAASIVRQSGSARAVGLLATIIVILFTIIYYFYELDPLNLSVSRLEAEAAQQQVVAVERGYNLYQANCASCHGVDGEGGIGPILNDQSKLYAHLSDAYIETVLEVGGRYVCGNADSIMPVWSDQGTPPGPLNYRQIEELVAFIRAPSDEEFEARDPELNEPLRDPVTGELVTFHGWRDPDYVPPPDATPVPACWSATAEPSGSPGATPPPDATVLDLVAVNIAFDTDALTAPADEPFVIHLDNQDTGVPHDVDIRTTDGEALVDNPTINGVAETDYTIEPLEAGTYTFICSIHPIPAMTGTLTVE